MEAIPEITYLMEHNPELQETGEMVIHTTFNGLVDMDPTVTQSRFSCSLPATEFIEDEASPKTKELYNFLTEELRVDEFDAITLLQKLIQLAISLTSSVEFCAHYALTMWLTLNVVPLNQGSDLDDSPFEEVIRASLDDYERNIGFKPASKLGLGSLSTRIYKRRPKTILVSDRKTKRKIILTKRKTSSMSNHCTICLEEFKEGQEVGTLPCGHEFDNKCIEKWLKVGHTCPLCRYELPCEDDDEYSHANHGVLAN
ncbi:E3 ubiquitin-protein ligase RING1-like [Eutrema salsugineum]|uniref:E3 ubiquitin-protein ligase RING1-like n=1 Tax=Eutrema salsugineum TaxID=72664 RepID=UPI000CECF8B1|nr:E3 ubiquitin-protein ligase RING1-like [Eutrema salsugineum]